MHGHTATTLAALRTADALLFVCDSRQAILKPELDFLLEAARRVPTVVVAMTKRDLSPAYARIVEDTRARITATGALRDVPVLAVAAPLADMAAKTTDQRRAGQLRDLSGVEPLLAALRRYSTTGAEQVRFHNAARVLAEVCRALAAQTQEIVDILAGNAQRGQQLHREIDELQDAVDHSAGSPGRSATVSTTSAASRCPRSATPSTRCGRGTRPMPSGVRPPNCRPWPIS